MQMAGSESRSPERQQSRREALGLGMLRRAVETGDCKLLKTFMDDFGSCLSSSAEQAVRDEYHRIREEAERAFRTEAVHGCGALLKLDHPKVAELIQRRIKGRPIIGPEEIEAAKRYSTLGGLAQANV